MSEEHNQEYVFVWKIQNFSNNFYENGDEINSPVFTIESFQNSQWFLRMYPNGNNKNNSKYISIYLYKETNDKCPEECKLIYELDMIGGDGQLLQTRRTESNIYKDNSKTSNWGFNNFIFVTNVTDKMKDWLEDILTLRCRMFFKSQQSRSECEARTEIGVDRQTLVWNVRIQNISSQNVKKELPISKESVFEIILTMPGDTLKVDICSRRESSNPKSVSCRLALVDSKGKELISKRANHLFKAKCEKETWEFPDFITKKLLDDNKTAFVENGTICLLCKWVSSNGKVTDTILGSNCDSNSCSTLQMQFKNMLLDNTYSDVKLNTENEVVQAHKCILAARSPVFSAMFQQDMVESKTNTVNIPDVEAGILKSFLQFVYTETVENLDCESARKLLLVAEKYQVLALKEKCVLFLKSILSLGNVFEILTLADMIGHERLKCAAVNIVVSNSEIVLNLPEWSILIENNAKLATEIISKIVCSKNDTN